MARVVVDLDLQTVGAAGSRGERHGLDIAGVAGGVAGVGDDGQVRQVVQHRHGVEVEGVAGAGLEGANAALAQDDVVVALAHDVLGSHEQLIDGAGHAALEQDRGLGLADLLEQGEFCALRAPICMTSIFLSKKTCTSRGSMISVTIGMSSSADASHSRSRPAGPMPW